MKASVRVLGRKRVPEGREKREQSEWVATEAHEGGEPVDERPRSVYEVLTRQMLEEVKSDVNEVKNRVNALLWLVIGSTVVELVTKLVK